MTPAKAACIEINDNLYAEGTDIVVSYNINFDEADPLFVDGLICIYLCNSYRLRGGYDLTMWKPSSCAATENTGWRGCPCERRQFPKPAAGDAVRSS